MRLPRQFTLVICRLLPSRPARVAPCSFRFARRGRLLRSPPNCIVPAKSLEQCWTQKDRTYADAEKPQAKQDYEHARQVYRKLLAESPVD